ncbi:hypothetical protein SRHO_G00023360 [Serrasalmus rhombeus]
MHAQQHCDIDVYKHVCFTGLCALPFIQSPVTVLNRILAREDEADTGIKTMKKILPPCWNRDIKTDSAAPIPTSVCPSPVSICSNPPASSPSPASTTSTSSSPGGSSTFHPDWVDNFQIPWQKLPEELLQSLERQKRPSPRLRREMIRIVVSEIMKVCSNPTKRNSTEIGKRMVAKYPKSLQDVIEGDVVGPGYHSLAKQLQARVDNVK